MKKLLFSMLLIFSVTFAFSAKAVKRSTIDTTRISVAKVDPSFPGGKVAYDQFLSKQVKYPAKMREDGTQGKVVIRFIVDKDGTAHNFKVKTSLCPEADQEAKRVFSLVPKWTPGSINGKIVRTTKELTLYFALSE